MSRSPQAAVRNAVESFTAEKDVKKIVLQSGVVAFFASELATNDLLPSDIDVLLSGVKFLLQNWDTCYAGQPAWPDLCYYITGWLCIAVKIHGNDAALNKSVRNLQFALSKCSKTEQNRAVYFLLSQAADLVTIRSKDIASIADSCGKSVALLFQAMIHFMLTSRPVESKLVDTNSDSCCSDVEAKEFIAFITSQSVVEIVVLGLPTTTSGQLLIYTADSVMTLLGVMASAMPGDSALTVKGKRTKSATKSAVGDIMNGSENELNLLVMFVFNNLNFLKTGKLFEWALKLCHQVRSDASIWAVHFLTILVRCVKLKLLSEEQVGSSRVIDIVHYLCALACDASSLVINGAKGLGTNSEPIAIILAKVWRELLEISALITDTEIAAASSCIITKSLYILESIYFNNALEGRVDCSLLESIPLLMKFAVLSDDSCGGVTYTLSCFQQLVCAISLKENKLDETYSAAHRHICGETIIGIDTCAGFLRDFLANGTPTYQDFHTQSLLFRLFSPVYKFISGDHAYCGELNKDAAVLYSVCLGLGYHLLAAATRACNALGLINSGDVKLMTGFISLVGRWKSVLTYATSKAQNVVYALTSCSHGILSGLTELVVSMAESGACDQLLTVLPAPDLTSLVHAAVARKSAHFRTGFVDALNSIRIIQQPLNEKTAVSGGRVPVEHRVIMISELNSVVSSLSGVLELNVAVSESAQSPFATLNDKLFDMLSTSLIDRISLISMNYASTDCDRPLDGVSVELTLMERTLKVTVNDVLNWSPAVKDRMLSSVLNSEFASCGYTSDIFKILLEDIQKSKDGVAHCKMFRFIVAFVYNIELLVESLAFSAVALDVVVVARVYSLGMLSCLYEHIGIVNSELSFNNTWRDLMSILCSPLVDSFCKSSEQEFKKNKVGKGKVPFLKCCESILACDALFRVINQDICVIADENDLHPFMNRIKNMLESSDLKILDNLPTGLVSMSIVHLFEICGIQGNFDFMVLLVRVQQNLPIQHQKGTLYIWTILQLQLGYNGLVSKDGPPISGGLCQQLQDFIAQSRKLLRIEGLGALSDDVAPVYFGTESIFVKDKWMNSMKLCEYLRIIDHILACSISFEPFEDARAVKLVSFWICMLGAKCAMCAFSGLNAALSLVKRGLRYLDLGSVANRLDPAGLLGRFEAMLLIGELHEQMGQVDRALPYLAEAKSTAIVACVKSGAVDSKISEESKQSDILTKVYNLHISRIWCRLASTRFNDTIELIQSSGNDVTHKLIFEIGALLSCALSDNNSLSRKTVISSYRNVWWQLDFFPTTTHFFHTSLNPLLRHDITNCLSATSTWTLESIGQLAMKCEDVFDVSRALKRRMAVEAITLGSHKNSYTSFAPFFFSTSSCSTSTIPNQDALIDICPANNSNAKGSSHSLSELQHHALLSGDGGHIKDTENHIRSILETSMESDLCTGKSIAKHEMASTELRGRRNIGTMLMSISIDDSCSRLILCRFDILFGAISVSLPFSADLVKLLRKWDALTTENVEQLTMTLSTDTFSKWSAKDKKTWWDERSALDDKMESFLGELSSALGPWRFMLADTITASNVKPASVVSDAEDALKAANFEQLLCCELSVPPTKGTIARGSAISKSKSSLKLSHLCDENIVQSLFPAIRLLLCSLDPVWLTPALTATECREAILQFFGDCGEGATTCPRLSLLSDQISASIVTAVDTMITDFAAKRASEATSVVGTDYEKDSGLIDEPRFADMTVIELKAALKALSLPVTGKKAELVERLKSVKSALPDGENNSVRHTTAKLPAVKVKHENSHTILILDERMQSLPWENTLMLRYRQCSRVPNLRLLCSLAAPDRTQLKNSHVNGLDQERGANTPCDLSDLLNGLRISDANENDSKASSDATDILKKDPIVKSKRKVLDEMSKERSNVFSVESKKKAGKGSNSAYPMCESKSGSWYCIDPESNLPRTRETMSFFLQPLAAKYGWTGVVGELPDEETVRRLHEDNAFFIYSGHGAGDKLFNSQGFRKLSSCPASFLWGCSSGKLYKQGVHDPSGTVLCYLLSGARFVVGNLWDVTDVDIDKLSVKCMTSLLAGNSYESRDLSAALIEARSACKLKCAVGFAPVVYGLPTRLYHISS